jgi:predicted ATPase/class 3 adenylate cyclase
MDPGGWLRSLGLEQYERAFRKNAIDDAVLPSLTAEDLKDLGVALVGHRRKLLEAIAALRSGTGAKAALPDATVEKSPSDTAERRQITVMFSDLVGSTALSARMDPEDLRELISAYQKCVAETVRRFDGFVAKYMGDGVLAYFGYPQAHEDDAERAVRAGLELMGAVTGLKTTAPLQTRVGIATGLVVVGDLIGSGEAQEFGIVGETPNLAARLQGVAEPNTVVIAEGTRKLLGNLFELHDLGFKGLKGIAWPVRAWAALRPSSVASRFEALHTSRLTALVGREEESELLVRLWSRAKTGEGQVVLLSGEAGIGKSRLTAALLEHLITEPHTRLRYFCSPQHTDSALYPIVGQMERAAGLAHDDIPKAKLDKLDALFAQTKASTEDAALFAEMLSLPNDGRYPALNLAPQQRRQRTLEALTLQIEVLSRSKPVLMIFEDAHWTDPSSLEAFGRILDRIATLRVLMIVTFRPEFQPPSMQCSHVTTLTISRLTEREVGIMIDQIVGERLLPASIKQDIIERCDGIPLFVEEMTKAVLEERSQSAAAQGVAAVPSPALAIPASLYSSLLARLDRLGSAKEVAQIGSALGRAFPYALLAKVMLWPEAELESALDLLIEAGLLSRQGGPPHAIYLFKHALVQDAAYGTLLRSPKRALHARIAETLESQFSEIAESQPELMAHHCAEAGLIEKAASLWGKAGRQSHGHCALAEAVAQLTKALSLMASLPATPGLRREQLNIQVALADTLKHVKGYAAPETIAAFADARSMIERAISLQEPPEDPLLLFSVLNGLWVSKFVAFDGEAALKRAREMLSIAEQADSAAAILIGARSMGLTLVLLGQLEEARLQLDRSISIDHRQLNFRFGQVDPAVAALAYHSWAMWLLGYPKAATKDAETVLRNARQLNDATTLMYALFHVCMLEILCRNVSAAEAHAHELLSLAEGKGVPQWRAHGIILRGRTLSMRAEAEEGVRLIEAGLDAFESTGASHFKPIALAELAHAYGQCGKHGKAKNRVAMALKAAEKTKERWAESEIYRTAGELSLATHNYHAAEFHFIRSLAIARRQRAKMWELRTATSLARLWRDQGRRNEAFDLLRGIYAWFTEGFDTLDLTEARTLLGALAS